MLKLEGTNFFKEPFPVHVNRIVESFELSAHCHDFVEINYVAEGKGMHYIDDEAYPAVKGDLFFLPVGTSHVFRPSTPDRRKPFVVFNCLFPPSLIEAWAVSLPVPAAIVNGLFAAPGQRSWLSASDTGEEFHRLFKSMKLEYAHKSPGYAAVVSGALLELLGLLSRSAAEREPSSAASDQESNALFERARRYVEENTGLPELGARDIAAHLGIGETRVYRLFKAHAGVTMLTYIHNERMERASRLLRETSYKVQHIAEMCGCPDLKHFHALFKRKVGLTPHQYRIARRSLRMGR